MDIAFRNRKLAKTFNDYGKLQRTYGDEMANVIKARMALLKSARSLELVPSTPPDRRHQLKGSRKEQFAVDLVNPHRLVFKVNHSPTPKKPDGGIDISQVTAITILEVVDYH